MKRITLYRSMFKTVDGESEFNYVLNKLGVTVTDLDTVHSVDLMIESCVSETEL